MMNFHRAVLVLLCPLLLLFGLKSSVAAPATENVVRVHWLGLKQISADTNSAHFMAMWQLPQTGVLLAQTLDKLSRLPGHGATNAAGARLRPLLDDLVSSEFYLEVSAPANTQLSTLNTQLYFALRLPADRARLWQTNLAAALAALTGVHPVATEGGWLLQRQPPSEPVEFALVGGWTFVGLGQNTNFLQSEFATRITRATSATNSWLAADLDLPRLAGCLPPSAFGFRLLSLITRYASLSSLDFTFSGEKGDVLTRATLDFSRPLEAPLPAWEIPTNLIHAPVTSFTAVRGLAPWLAALPAWQNLQLSPPPDQACFWAQEGVPFLTYFAAPLPAASSQLAHLAGHLVPDANSWLATHAEGRLQWQTNPPALVWKNALILSPCLKPISVNQRDYVVGGLYPLTAGEAAPLTAGILHSVFDTPNLVYYQTEDTGQRIEDGQFILQLLRLVFHKRQLPGTAAAGLWLKYIEPLLGESTTLMTQTGTDQLVFTRQSTVGLTALELHLLADWLESPQFPHGLHTFRAPPGR